MTTFRSEFLKLDIDLDALAQQVSRALGWACRLTPLPVKCTYPVFRGDGDGARAVFVKVGMREEARRTRRILEEIGPCDLFARLLVKAPLEYQGLAVLVSEWRPSRVALMEDWNEAQVNGFIAGCVRLSAALQKVTAPVPLAGTPLEPDMAYGILARYAARHPLAVRPLASLLSLPERARSFAGHRLSVVHGDFHVRNFAFDGGRLASVFDFDKVTEGLACADLVNALVYRFAELGLSAAAKARLAAVARQVLARAPWPRAELALMTNVWRLRFAARRIVKHPDAAWVGVDVWRRDRQIRRILDLLEEVKK